MFWHSRESVGVKLNKLLKDLKTERVQGSSAVLNYSNFDYWVNWDDIVEIVENHKQPSLNENQQVVLDYLTSENRLTKEAPLLSINNFSESHFGGKLPEKVEEAYRKLNAEEDYEILAAFADWGRKQVAE